MFCLDCMYKHSRDLEHHMEDAVRVDKANRAFWEEQIDYIRKLRKHILSRMKGARGNPEELKPEHPPYIEYGKKTWVEHFAHPPCEPRSHRVIKPNPQHILTICCPKGQFDRTVTPPICRVATVRVKLEHLHPPGQGSCPVCG